MRIVLNSKSIGLLGLVLLQAFVVLIAACGGESATPVGTVPTTQAPVTTVAPQSDSGQPSTIGAQAVPSGQSGSSRLVRDWDQLLRGSRLATREIISGGSSGSFTETSDLDLCIDGSFTLYAESIVSIGMGGSNESSFEEGEWSILEEGGQAYLVLVLRGGETFAALLEIAADDIYVQGEKQLYGAAEGC